MKHMMLYENWQKKPMILLLHGLDGDIDNEQLSVLEELGYNVLSLTIDYRTVNAWDIIKDIKVDGVIGHSLGGFMAYYFSNFNKVPCLMFMPDFGKEMQNIQKLKKDILDLPVYKNKIVVIGTEDEDVDIEANNKILKGIKTFKVKSDHMPSIEVFKKYSKVFKKLN
jgi:hypothetical protein